jgi:hypothetical protein
MTPKRKTKLARRLPIKRTYKVTLIGGTEYTFMGTRLEQTKEYAIIWNEEISVRRYTRSEYENIE